MRMKSFLFTIIAMFFLCAPAEAKIRVYYATGLTGGTTGSLDNIDASNTLGDTSNIEAVNGDIAVVVVPDDQTYFYQLDADSGLAESSPDVIAPDDNAGNKRWILVNVYTKGEVPLSKFHGASLDTLAEVVTAIGAAEITLVIDKDISMGASITWPSTLALKTLNGATITLGAYNLDLANCPHVELTPGAINTNSTGRVTGLKFGKSSWFGVFSSASAATNTANLQYLLTAASVCEIEAGTFEVTGTATTDILESPSNREIYGHGKGVTTLKIPNNALAGTNTSFGILAIPSTASNVTVRGITFDGNRDNQTWLYNLNATYLMTVYGHDVIVEDCEFKEHVANGTGVPSDGYNVTFRNNWSHDHGKKPFYFGEVYGITVDGNYAYSSEYDCGIGFDQGIYKSKAINNYCWSNATAGIQTGDSSSGTHKDSKNLLISGNHCWLNQIGIQISQNVLSTGTGDELIRGLIVENNQLTGNTNNGLYIAYSRDFMILNNEISQNGLSGALIINSRDYVFRGNNVNGNGVTGTVGAAYNNGVYLQDTGSNQFTGALGNVVFENNFFGDTYAAPTQDYGFSAYGVASASWTDKLVLKNNVFKGNSVSATRWDANLWTVSTIKVSGNEGYVHPGETGEFTGLYSFATQGGVAGSFTLATIPDNATVTECQYETLIDPTSGGAATIAFGVATDDATGLLGATAFDDASLNPGYHDGVPDGLATNFTTKTTAERGIIMTIGTADLTAGKIRIWGKYKVGD